MDWKELETALIKVPEVRELTLYEVKYSSETWDTVKSLAKLFKGVRVDRLRLSEGRCEFEYLYPVPTTNNEEIKMSRVYLKSEADVRTLHHLVSQYKSWTVGNTLILTELGCDDWTVLAVWPMLGG